MDDAMRDEAMRLGWRRDWPPNDDGPEEFKAEASTQQHRHNLLLAPDVAPPYYSDEYPDFEGEAEGE